MSQSRLQVFNDYLVANAIPVDGLSANQPYGPTTVTIQYAASATQQQKDWAEQAKQTFDWRPRRFLNAATIASTIAGLTAGQQNTIIRRVVAQFIVEHEQLVIQTLAELGIALPYDEVDPS